MTVRQAKYRTEVGLGLWMGAAISAERMGGMGKGTETEVL